MRAAIRSLSFYCPKNERYQLFVGDVAVVVGDEERGERESDNHADKA
jgi:hypothetical protein